MTEHTLADSPDLKDAIEPALKDIFDERLQSLKQKAALMADCVQQ